MKKNLDVINFNDFAKVIWDKEPMFLEEVRRNQNGEVMAYVLKRNHKCKK